MATNHQISVSLPEQLAALVQRKVASGEYADESDVICDSLQLLDEQENGLERWLREEVVAASQELNADPSSGLTSNEVLAGLEAARRQRKKTP
jgi:antitoxin ParD1/3/4